MQKTVSLNGRILEYRLVQLQAPIDQQRFRSMFFREDHKMTANTLCKGSNVTERSKPCQPRLPGFFYRHDCPLSKRLNVYPAGRAPHSYPDRTRYTLGILRHGCL